MMSDFDLEIRSNGEIYIGLELPKNWKKLIPPINNENYIKDLHDYSNKIAKSSGLEKAIIGWDDEWGLSKIDVYYGNATALLLNKDDTDPSYFPHNILTLNQAFTLMSTLLKYIHDVRIANIKSKKEFPLTWDIWQIEPDAMNELWIKIDLHPKLEEITSHFDKKNYRHFIEGYTPFLEKGYKRLKEVKFNWDDKLGLRSVEVLPGRNGSSLNLTKDENNNFHYLSHNIYNPIQAVALIGVVSKYLKCIKDLEKEKSNIP